MSFEISLKHQANPETIAPSPEKKSVLKPKGSCAPPNPHLVSAATGIERRVDHERRLFSAANWNAKHAAILFQVGVLYWVLLYGFMVKSSV